MGDGAQDHEREDQGAVGAGEDEGVADAVGRVREELRGGNRTDEEGKPVPSGRGRAAADGGRSQQEAQEVTVMAATSTFV